MNQAAKSIECPTHENRVLREALVEARATLHDWLVTDASDYCYPEQVELARERFRRRGGRINCTAEVTANITEILGDQKPEGEL